LPSGVPPLDRLAEQQWRRAEIAPVAIANVSALTHDMMQLAAGLHCFVGPIPTRWC
jgi:hypothetical protein